MLVMYSADAALALVAEAAAAAAEEAKPRLSSELKKKLP